MDQTAALMGAMSGTFSLAPLSSRPPDVVTWAHWRAAERVHEVAGWFLRGSDLAVLKTRTPFLAEDAKDLWQYYDDLPLHRRLELPVALVAASVYFVRPDGVVSRQKYPRLCWLIDLYTVAVGVVSMWPKQVFYYMHLFIWELSKREARTRCREPATPLPLSAANLGAASDAGAQAMSFLNGLFGSAKELAAPAQRSSRSTLDALTWAVGLSAAGIGAYLLFADAARRRHVEDSARRWLSTLFRGRTGGNPDVDATFEGTPARRGQQLLPSAPPAEAMGMQL